MKKIYLIPLTLLLVGCSTTNNEKTIKILCPTGAPAVAFYNYSTSGDFETGNAQNIASMFTKTSPYSAIVIDTLSGIKAIENGAPYKLASTLTFGNFYIAATGNDDNETIDKDDSIVLFSKGMTPDIIFHYIYGDIYNETIQYVDNVNTAKSVLETGKNLDGTLIDYVFIAEPALTGAKKVNPKVKTIVNIQEEYKKKSDNKSLIQASLFIKNDLDKEQADSFLNRLEKDINDGLLDPQKVFDSMNKNENAVQLFGVTPALAKTTLMNNNAIGLGYKRSKDIKGDIDHFLELLGKDITDEKIYY